MLYYPLLLGFEQKVWFYPRFWSRRGPLASGDAALFGLWKNTG